jgi:hypothetical protein
MGITLIPDEELRLLADVAGPFSAEAHTIRELCEWRAKDWLVFAFRVGDYIWTGPVPDAETEAALIACSRADD